MLNLQRNELNYISKIELYGILDTMPFPIILTEANKSIRFANAEALKLGGYDNLLGRKCIDTFCRRTICNCPVQADEKIYNAKQPFFTNTGEIIPVMKKAQPVHFNNEFFVAQFFIDLTQQQQKEDELRNMIAEKELAKQKAENERHKFEQLFEGVSEAVFVVSENGKIIKVNRKACDLHGYTTEELESFNIKELVETNAWKRLNICTQKLEHEGQVIIESVHVTKSGKQFPVEVSTNCFEYDGNKVILTIVRDITFRKQIENELLEAKQITEHNETELRTIFNKVPSTIIVFDKDTRILRINQKGSLKFKTTGDKAKTKRIGEVLNCVNLQTENSHCGNTENCSQCTLLKLIDSTVKKGIEHNKTEVTLDLLDNDIVVRHTVLLSTAILGSNGTSRYIATIDDITDRKKMETELVAAKEKAEISEKLKTAFLNNISHEIRTPLNGLLGFLDFFEDDITQLSKEDRRLFIQTMRKSGDRLAHTVEDIVETSKLDSGIIDIKKEPVSLKKIADQLETDIKHRYSQSGVEFNCIVAQQLLNCEVKTDESKLLRILRNLIGNAFKFTQKGKVVFEISEAKDQIIFSVSDTGIGIDSKDMDIIFEPFCQADLNLNRAFEGNGLGLTIAKKMVSFLGGELQVRSEKGKGSCFSFALPKSEASTDKVSTVGVDTINSDNSLLGGKTILVAEDDETNYLFLQAVLQKEGCILRHAKNGKEAVNLFKQNPEIDLIIMDLKMPVMSGIDATFRIKAIDNSVPIIAHSAYVLNNEKEQSLAAGCIDYIPKPVKKQELIKVIKKHIKSNR